MKFSPYYEVQITKGRFVERGMKTETKKFLDADLMIARSSAIEYAWRHKLESNHDDPSFIYSTPALIPMLNVFSIDVYLWTGEDEYYVIYGGAEIRQTLEDLAGEAYYYLHNGLIRKDELIILLQNRNENDEENPAFVVGSFVEEVPEFDYDVIEILPDQFSKMMLLIIKG